MDKNDLDINFIYCKQCFDKGIISEVKLNKDKTFNKNCQCYYRNNSVLVFHLNEWHIFRGGVYENSCVTCRMRKNNKQEYMNEARHKSALKMNQNMIEREKSDSYYRAYKQRIRSENGTKVGKITGIKNVQIMIKNNNELYRTNPEFRKLKANIARQNYYKAIENGNLGIGIKSFDEKGNFYDYFTSSYINFEEYCNNLNKKLILIRSDLEKEFDCFIPTFLSQNNKYWREKPNAWSGFQQYLVNNNYLWTVYVKYDTLQRPLVVGKSGSLLVNKCGHDLSFSLDVSHGPARVKLNNERLDWCRTQILIKNFQTEKEAYDFESYIQKKYELLGS